MTLRAAKLAAVVAAATALAGASVATAGGPPPPTSHNGNKPHLFASGLGTPTAFGFGGGAVFESDAGTQADTARVATGGHPSTRVTRSAVVKGGVYLLSHGSAKRISGSPPASFGIVWHKGTLYVSALNRLLAWSGWNGTGEDVSPRERSVVAGDVIPGAAQLLRERPAPRQSGIVAHYGRVGARLG